MTPAPQPFHRTEGVGRAERRLLLLSYHFPPSKAVGGVRWQKMIRFAVERGWGADVVCLAPASIDAPDVERLDDLPADVRLYGVPAVRESAYSPLLSAIDRSRRAARALTARRAAGAGGTPAPVAHAVSETGVSREAALARPLWSPASWPRTLLTAHFVSMSTRWARAAADVARRVATPAHRAVVSSGPPHEVHDAARRLARDLGVPFVPDLRDPWSLNECVPTGYGSRFYFTDAARREARVVADAAFVMSNTDFASRALAAEYPAHADKIITVMNGSDEAPAAADDVTPAAGGPLVVAYAGAVYMGRDPSVLFRAAARVVRARGLTPDDLRFEFAGPVDVSCRPVTTVAEEAGIAPFVTHHGVLTRVQTARLQARAHLLVSLPQEHDTAIPSKIFEYAARPAWILVLAGPSSAPAALLAGTDADVVAPDDEAALAAVLEARLDAHRRGERPVPVDQDGRFSRRRQAERFLDRLEQVLAR